MHVEVHRTGGGEVRTVHRLGGRAPRCGDPVWTLARRAQVGEVPDERAEEVALMHRLVGAAVVPLEGPIRREDQQRDERLGRLDDGGVVVGGRGARGAQEEARSAGDAGLAQGEEGGGALVQDVMAGELRVVGGGEDERRGARARAQHHVTDPGVGERGEQGTGPSGLKGGRGGHGQGSVSAGVEPRAPSTGRSLSDVSAYSASGEEPRTMPAPA
jgi:hypothetical protein